MRSQDEARISEFVQKLANAAPPAPPFPDVFESPATSPDPESLRWGQMLGFAAAVVLFLVVPFFVFTGDTPSPAPGAPETAPTTAIPLARLRYPITDHRIREDGVISASLRIPDPESLPHVSAVVAMQAQGGFEDAVSVNVIESDPGWPQIGEEVSMGNRVARVFTDSASTTVSWAAGGRFVWVQGSQKVDQETLLAIARSVIVTEGPFDSATLALGALPSGYTIFAAPRLLPSEAEPTLVLSGPPSGFPRTPPDDVIIIEVSSESPEHVAGRFPAGRKTVVRSVDGYLASRNGSAAYVWSERPGLTVSVSGTAPPEELLVVAESLRFVSEAEWNTLYDIAGSGPALPTTTIPNGGLCRADQIQGELGTGVSDVQGSAQVLVLTNVDVIECLLEQPISMSQVLETGEMMTGTHGVPISTIEPKDRVLVPGESMAVVYQIDEGCGSAEGLTALRLEMSNFAIDVPIEGVAGCLKHGFLAPWSNGQLGFEDVLTEPTLAQIGLVDHLMTFAMDPTAANHAVLSLSDEVVLTAGPEIANTVTAGDLTDPAAWVLATGEFRGGTGPVSVLSALRQLSEWPGGFDITIGPHPHCASAPQPPAAGLEDLTQISIQPAATESCLQWWVVDLFVDESNQIVGITYDIWEP